MTMKEEGAAPFCCASCFEHPWLKELVRASSTDTGTCGYCGGRRVRLIRVDALRDYISNLLLEYVDESYRGHEFPPEKHHAWARPLLSALQEDWCVFSPSVVTSGKAQELLNTTLSGFYRGPGEAPIPDRWVLKLSDQAMRTEARAFARMFGGDLAWPAHTLDEIVEAIAMPATPEWQVAGHLAYFAIRLEGQKVLFRARPGCEQTKGLNIPHSDLGPNPAHPASRANRSGEYSIYLAESEETAVGEIRQSVGSSVSVGEFLSSSDLMIVDLCQSSAPPNPFVTRNLTWVLDLLNLYRAVAAIMSKPAQDEQEYLTTQFLADIARAVGYDGIRYPSAVDSTGRNIVLFKAKAVQLRASWVDVVGSEGMRRM
jgi:RES domain-containing protein